jgi:hypothetical protein
MFSGSFAIGRVHEVGAKAEQLAPMVVRYPNGRVGGVVVIESIGLLHARLKASLAGADRELEFASGHQLDPISAQLIPANNDRQVSR